ncbi:transcription factor AP-4 isoform X2 [Diabrotica virgifera virgifera]|uniref:Transcription factor AP-4 isoform X2 n=1 Tax=Diabrotica virgifera virgifera TaxID=50390 RepID=A0A6P7FCJ5_DIAVI|nr:transcription factor AP-4 isoform X2 [Diabrotica virgifera virgifera]
MSVYVMKEDIVYDEGNSDQKDVLGNISRINKGGEPPTATMEQEKRIRREIANSNERRRMQSINNGFQSLRNLLPHHEGEKLSKAAILQQTAEYIYSLEQEKTRLLSQNCQLKRLVNQHEGGELPPKKRKTELIIPTITAESSDEGIGSMSPELIVVNQQPDNTTELKQQLEQERSLRLLLEDQVRQLEEQLFQSQRQPQPQFLELEDTDAVGMQLIAAESLPIGHTQTVVCSASPANSRSSSPIPVMPEQQRLPSVLEAAIKAEPKVEVERLPSPNTSTHEDNSRVYNISNTSRQNLETIVEAIRHLEGSHMFDDEQDVPLALTTRSADIKPDVHAAYLEFNATTVQQYQQSRPGVIVVKQAS